MHNTQHSTQHNTKQYEQAQQILQLIDLTSLNYDDNHIKIAELCAKAITPFGNVAAICIYSQFVPQAKQLLQFLDSQHDTLRQNQQGQQNSSVRIATVTNFPNGANDIAVALFETNLALDRGADEVDIVFPYHALIAGDSIIGANMIKAAKQLCQNKTLKVIIESGALKTHELIKLASKISIDNGADFIKTSTGKTTINATIDAAEIMLNEIKHSNGLHDSNNSKGKCGFKASGGIKTVAEAMQYINLAKHIMGEAWITPENFRFGASSLLSDVLNVLGNGTGSNQNGEGYVSGSNDKRDKSGEKHDY